MMEDIASGKLKIDEKVVNSGNSQEMAGEDCGYQLNHHVRLVTNQSRLHMPE